MKCTPQTHWVHLLFNEFITAKLLTPYVVRNEKLFIHSPGVLFYCTCVPCTHSCLYCQLMKRYWLARWYFEYFSEWWNSASRHGQHKFVQEHIQQMVYELTIEFLWKSPSMQNLPLLIHFANAMAPHRVDNCDMISALFYITATLLHVVTYQGLNFKGGLTKPQLKLWHGWAFTSHRKPCL